MPTTQEALNQLLSPDQSIFVDIIKNSNLQLTNYFDFFIFRRIDPTNALSAVTSALSIGLDAAIAKLYSRSVQLPSSRKIEYDYVDSVSYPTGSSDLDEITVDFFETEFGTTTRYLQAWLDEIFLIDEIETGIKQKVWNTNQNASKRDAELLLKQKNGNIVQLFPVIRIVGLKLSEFTIPEVSHDDSEIMKISATFTVDDIIVNTSLINI